MFISTSTLVDRLNVGVKPTDDGRFHFHIGSGEYVKIATGILTLDELEVIHAAVTNAIHEAKRAEWTNYELVRSENPNARDNGPGMHDLPDRTDPDGDESVDSLLHEGRE